LEAVLSVQPMLRLYNKGQLPFIMEESWDGSEKN
jgi:hypothetical protein